MNRDILAQLCCDCNFILFVMAAAVTSAAVIAAGMTFAMMMVVMIAADIGIVCQLSGQESLHRIVSVTGDTAKKLNARVGQRHLRATADAAANQDLRAHAAQQASQGPMTAAAGIINLSGNNLAIPDLINLKLRGVTKMLEDFPLPISNRDSHYLCSFRLVLWVYYTADFINCNLGQPSENVNFYFHFLYILYIFPEYSLDMESGGSREPPPT